AQAEAETGLHDFGSGQFRGSLAAFAGFVNSQDQLGADDRRAGVGPRVNGLGPRPRPWADPERHPGDAVRHKRGPPHRVGSQRAGPARMHALLAAAPGNRAPLYWEIARPSPPPSLAAAGDPRIGEGTRDIERWLAGYPGFIAQHPYFDAGGETPMECESLL